MNTLILRLRHEEHGGTIIYTLIILLIATIIGIAASNTSTFEIKGAGNNKVFKQNLYMAEGAAMEAAQLLADEVADALQDRDEAWMNDDSIDFTDKDNWIWDTLDTNVNSKISALNDDPANPYLYFTVSDKGAAHGAQMNMGEDELTTHGLAVYSVYDHPQRGRVMIEVGYKRKF